MDVDLVLRMETSESGQSSLMAEVREDADSHGAAVTSALARVKGFAAILGLEANIGLIVEEERVTSHQIQPPIVEVKGENREVRVFEEARVTDRLHVELIPSQDRLVQVYRHFQELAKSERSALIALAELYSVSWHEQFDRSRFITLVSVIEALLPAAETIPEVQGILDESVRLISEAQSALAERPLSPEAQAAERRMVQLRNRLEDLRRESIRDRLHRLATRLQPQVEDATRTIEEIYALRSSMLHAYLSADPTQLPQLTEAARQVAETLLRSELAAARGRAQSK